MVCRAHGQFENERLAPFGSPDDFDDFLKSLDEELAELAGKAEPETKDSAARAAELSRQLMEFRKALHEAEQGLR